MVRLPEKKVSCSWVRVCLLVVNLVPPTLSWTMSGEDLARQPGGELLISRASLCNVSKPQYNDSGDIHCKVDNVTTEKNLQSAAA